MGSIRDNLQAIATTKAFDRLCQYHDPSVWGSFSIEDQELLAQLFVLQGEHQLSRGEPATTSFQAATLIAPQNANIYLKQGLAFLGRTTDIDCLRQACTCFQEAAGLQYDLFSIWFHWGIALVRIGVHFADSAFLREADEKFLKATRLVHKSQEKGVLLWRWALCWFAMGKLSGEACDFRIAVDKMQEAEALGLREPTFWNDYGYILQELGLLVHRTEILQQAAVYFQNAIQAKPDHAEAWLGLAVLMQRLYAVKGDRSCFIESDRAFRQLTTISTHSLDLWLGWGQLYLGYGKLHRDLEMLRLALERYEKAGSFGGDHLVVQCGWAEVQILVGGMTERIELIREGLRKIERCMEIAPEHIRIRYLHASGLLELGRYFGDESYHERAIEKLKQGLTLQHADPLLWYGLAQAHFALGDLRGDSELLERAVHCCSQVVELGGMGVPQFFNDWGVALMRLSELTNSKRLIEEAIEKFEQAVAMQFKSAEADGRGRESLDPEWLYNYGCALTFLGDYSDDPQCYEKAIQVLSQVIILDANFSHARYNLALAFSHLGELVNDVDCLYKSLELFQSVVEQDPEDEIAWTDWGIALINLAQLVRDPSRSEYAAGLLEQSEAKLLQAAALGSTTVYYHLACVYSLMNHHATAIFYLERADASGGLPSLDEVTQDEWLEGLRHTDQFRQLLHQLANKNRAENQ